MNMFKVIRRAINLKLEKQINDLYDLLSIILFDAFMYFFARI